MFLWTPGIGHLIFKTRLWVRRVGHVKKTPWFRFLCFSWFYAPAIPVAVVLPIWGLYINLKAKFLLNQQVSRTAVNFFFVTGRCFTSALGALWAVRWPWARRRRLDPWLVSTTFTLTASLVWTKLRCCVRAEDPTSPSKSQSRRNFVQLSVWEKRLNCIDLLTVALPKCCRELLTNYRTLKASGLMIWLIIRVVL